MKKILALLIIFITLPSVAQAKILINEIAWMGILGEGGANGEWIELRNSGGAQDVTDWILYKKQNEVEIKMGVLSGVIESGDFYILERSTKTMPNPIPDSSDGQLLSGLINLPVGEYLVLRDREGNLVEEFDFRSGWSAGDNKTKQTMQRTYADTWITAQATPNKENIQKNIAPVESKTSTTSSSKKTEEVVLKDPSITMSIPEKVYAGIYTDYITTIVVPEKKRNVVFLWNMGDGTVFESSKINGIKHAYAYPGTYTISFVYKDQKTDKILARAQKSISVLPSTITISLQENDGIAISHTENFAIDISGWYIRTPNAEVRIPSFTTLSPKSTMVILFDRLGIPSSDFLELLDTEKRVVAHSILKEISVKSVVVSNQARIKTPPKEGGDIDEAVFVQADVKSSIEKQKSRTRYFLIGAASLVCIAVLVFLERITAQKE